MNRKHTADTLFVVLLYGLFALLSLLLILIGARVYKRTVEHTEARGMCARPFPTWPTRLGPPTASLSKPGMACLCWS